MPLFPEDIKINNNEMEIEVSHCSCCPFSYEIIDEMGDYVGNTCYISSCKFLLKNGNEFPKKCPLRNKEYNLKIKLKGNK